jgi:hypothetical protein
VIQPLAKRIEEHGSCKKMRSIVDWVSQFPHLTNTTVDDRFYIQLPNPEIGFDEVIAKMPTINWFPK